MGISNVGVNLGCRNVGVAEQGLDGAEVCAVHEKVCSERVAERMRGNVLGNACEASVFFYNTLDAARSEAAIVAIRRGGAGVFRVIQKQGWQGIVADGEIIFDARGGGFVNKNRAVF